MKSETYSVVPQHQFTTLFWKMQPGFAIGKAEFVGLESYDPSVTADAVPPVSPAGSVGAFACAKVSTGHPRPFRGG